MHEVVGNLETPRRLTGEIQERCLGDPSAWEARGRRCPRRCPEVCLPIAVGLDVLLLPICDNTIGDSLPPVPVVPQNLKLELRLGTMGSFNSQERRGVFEVCGSSGPHSPWISETGASYS